VFTLLEAVAVMAIIGILSAVAVVGYNGVRRGQLDAAGQPVLGAALVDGRRVVAVSAQKTRRQFPAQDVLLAALMGSRDVSVNGSNVTYTLGGSKELGVVAVLRGDPNTVGYAAATSVGTGSYAAGNAADVNCLFAVDDLVNGTTYAKMKMPTDPAQTGCIPLLRFFCPGGPHPPGNGSAESPYDLGITRPPDSCVGVPLEPLDAPLCVAAQPSDTATGPAKATLSWVPSTTADRTASYTATVVPATGTPVPPIDAATRTTTIAGLTAGAAYTVNLSAVDAGGFATAATASNSFVAAPAGPGALTAVPRAVGSVAHMDLTWAAPAGAQSASYTYTLTRVPAFASAPAATAGLSYTDDAVSPGATYTYTVRTNAPVASPVIKCGLSISTPAGASSYTTKITLPVPPYLTDPVVDDLQTNKLDWTDTPSATSYTLYNCATTPCTKATPGATSIYTGPASSYDHTGRAWGSPATYYGVYAINDSGAGPVSNTARAQTTAAAPSLSGDVIAQLNMMHWSGVPGATGYKLYRAGVLVYTGTALAYPDAGRPWGLTSTYTIVSVNGSGDSSQSAPTSLLTGPDAPVLSGAVPAASTTVNLSWTAQAGATSYRLYSPAVGASTLIYAGAATSFADTGNAWGSTSTYAVYAHNASPDNYGDSRASNTVTAVITLPATQLPTAYPNGYGSNYLAWPATTGALRYGVFRSATPAGAYTLLATVTARTYTDATAALGSTWYYEVTAYFTAALTPATTSSANAVLQFPAVPVTSGFAARGSGATSGNVVDGTNHVAWGASAGSASYQLYVSQGGAPSLVAATAALGYDHTGRALGSRADYFAVGVNACHNDPTDPQAGTSCLSPNKPSGPAAPVDVSVYQRPAAPAPSVTVAPSLATNFTRLVFTRNGDAGSPPAAKFCDVPGLCNYGLERSLDGAAYAATSWTPYYGGGMYTLDPATSDANNSGYWGRIFDWRVHTWNPGGWSDYSAADRTLTYPSPFAVTAATLTSGYKFVTTAGLSGSNTYDQSLDWGGAYGTGMAYWYRANPSYAWVYTGTGTATGAASKASAGSLYAYTIQAQSDNGRIRQIGYTIQSAPATIRHIQARWQCLESNDTWRIRYDSVDSRPVSGFAADYAYYDLLPSPYNGGTHNSGTDGVHALVSATAFTPNTIQTGWASNAMVNKTGVGAYMTFENRANTRAGVSRVLNYSVALALGTNRSSSALFTGCGGSNTAWEYVSAVTANYPDGSVPRTLTAYAP